MRIERVDPTLDGDRVLAQVFGDFITVQTAAYQEYPVETVVIPRLF
jgi:hypothetical protein